MIKYENTLELLKIINKCEQFLYENYMPNLKYSLEGRA